MFARYVARRYLFSSASRSVIHLISVLSAVAVAMPVAAMIVLLSVFNGFEGLVRSMGETADPDLTVTPAAGATFRPCGLDTAALARIPGIETLGFVLEQSALADRDGRQCVVTVRGIDDSCAALLSPLASTVCAGEFLTRRGDLDYLVAGRSLARSLGVRTLADADITLYALRRGDFTPLLPLANFRRRTLPLAGIYHPDDNGGEHRVYTSLRRARELFSYPDRVTALYLRTAPGADPDAVKRSVARIAGPDFRVRTRAELQASFHAVMKAEKWGIFFISLLVLFVAAFSIAGALAMLITDKRRDIATLRALGAPLPLVRSLFRTEGWLIAGTGAACGALLGIALCLVQQHLGLIEIPADTFLTKSYPVALRWTDLPAVAGAVVLVTACVTQCTVRSMLPNENVTRP
ncbi:ABC transporter permease [uncultured Alistipes sp.]|uniref:ABC transporter permease n=1 Tax=uncultured Alistipes sp. TaxID=538949 RepID=UPI00266EE61F|nr:ABC transporter permease [uncultured Alistipes sp.]